VRFTVKPSICVHVATLPGDAGNSGETRHVQQQGIRLVIRFFRHFERVRCGRHNRRVVGRFGPRPTSRPGRFGFFPEEGGFQADGLEDDQQEERQEERQEEGRLLRGPVFF